MCSIIEFSITVSISIVHNKPSPFLPSLGTAQVKLAGDIQIYIQIYWGKENPVPKPETLKKIGHNLISLLKQP